MRIGDNIRHELHIKTAPGRRYISIVVKLTPLKPTKAGKRYKISYRGLDIGEIYKRPQIRTTPTGPLTFEIKVLPPTWGVRLHKINEFMVGYATTREACYAAVKRYRTWEKYRRKSA